IIEIEGDHWHPQICIRRPGGNERRHRPSFSNTFLQNLAIFYFVVVKQCLPIHRIVQLTFRRIDTDLPKQRVHSESSGFVWNNRNDAFADLLVSQELRQQTNHGHGGGHGMLSRSFEEFSVVTYIGETQGRRLDLALRNESAELVSTLQDVFRFRTIDGW